ncbi:hypothetical protein [Methylobacterium platani]|uniref:Uncharacterized protein n=2 Tax=Methylobacterium platani TaxID=427683 RepID=A0A179RT49_9HYPH|nr:hypothetical protein [Methylobacterium platani]KMO13662.1 hypothetical protein SQ03_21205 [Methylobacterium platani JCM 14648]OAS11910.1 hypothetical protein A5481_31635 [Methylobacterium platani]
MIATNSLADALPLVAALAEELAFALTSDLMAEQYRRPSPALDQLAAAKTFLDRHEHPVGPHAQEVVEIATAQGGLPS